MNDWFKERGIGQEQVAATLNVSVSTVSRIVNYKRDLSMRRAMILHTEYGIPFDVMYPSQLRWIHNVKRPVSIWSIETGRMQHIQCRTIPESPNF